MNEYELSIGSDEWCRHTEIALTAGKAKYDYYRYLQDGLWETDFGTFVKKANCRKIRKAGVSSFFGDKDSFERMCKSRIIEFAHMGMRVSVAGRMGTIVGSNYSGNLDVLFDGHCNTNNCHPWWETVYYDQPGNIIKDFREKARA